MSLNRSVIVLVGVVLIVITWFFFYSKKSAPSDLEWVRKYESNYNYFFILQKEGCTTCFYKSINYLSENVIDSLLIFTTKSDYSEINRYLNGKYLVKEYPHQEAQSLFKLGNPVIIERVSGNNNRIFVNDSPSNIDVLLEAVFY